MAQSPASPEPEEDLESSQLYGDHGDGENFSDHELEVDVPLPTTSRQVRQSPLVSSNLY